MCRETFWFAGKQFVGKAAPNQVLEWTAAAGDYEVTALDDHVLANVRDPRQTQA